MIKPYLNELNQKIKSRTKEEWVEYAKSQFKNLRNYIQANSELAFVAAFVLGIFVVVFFKLAFAILFLAALVAGMVWAIADSEIERRETDRRQDPKNDDVNPTIQ